MIGCNLSKKNKLALYKTQNGEPNLSFIWRDHNLLGTTFTKTWGQTSKYSRAGLLVGACIV